MWLYCVIITMIVIVGYIVFTHNFLTSLTDMSKTTWNDLDMQLKRRSDLALNLIEAVRGHMTHERDILEKIIDLRTKCIAANGNVLDRSQYENMLTAALRELFTLTNHHADLEASQNFIALQESLANIEDQIQLARRYYNSATSDLNTSVDSFPTLTIARLFNFKRAVYFEVDDVQARSIPSIDLAS